MPNIQALVKIRFHLAFCFQCLFQGRHIVSPPNYECCLFLPRVGSMSFKLPKEICLEQMHSPVLKFIIHHIHCSKSQTDKKDRKSVKFQPPCIQCPRGWNCSHVLQVCFPKWASPLQAGKWVLWHECLPGVSPPLQQAELGKNPTDHHLMPLSVTVTLQQLQLPPTCSSVYESLGWFSKGAYVPSTEMISIVDSWTNWTHQHTPCSSLWGAQFHSFWFWHFEPFWQKNINLNSSFMFTSEQWLCVGVTAGRSFDQS